MREGYDETGSTDRAIEFGLARTGKLVTSGALILMFAVLLLSASARYEIKLFAIGLAAGTIFDATVIHAPARAGADAAAGQRQLVDAALDTQGALHPPAGAPARSHDRERLAPATERSYCLNHHRGR
jgi:hypothetical protein